MVMLPTFGVPVALQTDGDIFVYPDPPWLTGNLVKDSDFEYSNCIRAKLSVLLSVIFEDRQ